MSVTITGYTLTAYGKMVLDEQRNEAYVAAMEQLIKPGDVVLEIGAGPGIFSMLAAKMGASKVIAVECNPSIRLAKRFVQHNGLADKVLCVKGLSTDLTLEKPADVIISDLRSVLPLYHQHIPSIIDARERLLAPGGTLIGCRDTLVAAPVEHSEEYRRINEPWRINQFDLDLTAGAEFETNHWSKVELHSDQLLAEGKNWCTLDYHSVSQPAVCGSLSWEVQRSGLLHGIATWFDAELAKGIGFSNHPEKPAMIYGQAFLPLPREVEVQSGDRLNAQIHAHWVNQNYIWQWKGEILAQEGRLIDRFDQSTLARRFTVAPGLAK